VPFDGRIVVLGEHEGTAPPKRLLETLGAGAGTPGEVRDRSARTVLLVSTEDEEKLQAIQAFVLLLQGAATSSQVDESQVGRENEPREVSGACARRPGSRTAPSFTELRVRTPGPTAPC